MLLFSGCAGLATAFHTLAIVTTIFRLYHRRKLGRLWVDDWWALVSLIFDIVHLATVWIRNDDRGESSLFIVYDGVTDNHFLQCLHPPFPSA
jgi:hypothetical protein